MQVQRILETNFWRKVIARDHIYTGLEKLSIHNKAATVRIVHSASEKYFFIERVLKTFAAFAATVEELSVITQLHRSSFKFESLLESIQHVVADSWQRNGENSGRFIKQHFYAWAMMHRFFEKRRQKLQNFLPRNYPIIQSA